LRDLVESLFSAERLWYDVIASQRGRERLNAQRSAARGDPLKAITAHAFENVAHYRRLRRSFGDNMPILTRKDVAHGGTLFHASAGSGDITHSATTSGTSGVALTIVRDDAARYACLHEANAALLSERVAPTQRTVCDEPMIVIVNDNPLHADVGALNPDLGYARTLRIVLGRSDEADAAKARYLAAVRPAVLTGRPRCLLALAKRLRTVRRRARPESVVCSGDELSEETRAKLEHAFEAQVRNAYASQEAGLIAIECRFRKGLHVRDTVKLEVLLDDGRIDTEGTGSIVLTPLDNYAMPLLRYSVGDRATVRRSACACGHTGVTITSLEGRVSPYFWVNGREMNPSVLLPVFEEARVERFQVVQDHAGRFTVRIWHSAHSRRCRSVLVRALSRAFHGHPVEFSDERVEPPLFPKFQRFVRM
jgi:phenylacetate-coenzyme A ligase PaaK-like adenylate-forming protein